MEPPPRLSHLLTRLEKTVRALLKREKIVAEPLSAMIGLPPSARGLTGRPTDVAEHAKQLAKEWADVGEEYVQTRMRELGIPDNQIGAPDYSRGGENHAFLPEEVTGGSNGVGRRLFVDSGILNPELNAEGIGPEASKVWPHSRLRDRIDAVISHEHQETQGLSHEVAI
jgi:hypothetical protein